jgi:hypothetical protein
MCAVCCDARQETDVPDLIPARMLNEFCYCPRLAYLEWVQGEFVDNLETREGRFGHRRVDASSRAEVPEPAGEVRGEGAEVGPHPSPLPEGEGEVESTHPPTANCQLRTENLPEGDGEAGSDSLTPDPQTLPPAPQTLPPDPQTLPPDPRPLTPDPRPLIPDP